MKNSLKNKLIIIISIIITNVIYSALSFIAIAESSLENRTPTMTILKTLAINLVYPIMIGLLSICERSGHEYTEDPNPPGWIKCDKDLGEIIFIILMIITASIVGSLIGLIINMIRKRISFNNEN